MDIIKKSLICILFVPIFCKAIRKRKGYLYLFFAFYTFLPDTFALEISKNLPLFTGGRCLLLLIMVMWLIKNKGKVNINNIRPFLFFFGVNLCVSIMNLKFGLQEINNIFILFFEKLLPVVVLQDMIENESEFERCIDFMIMGSVAVAIIGIMQTTLEIDLAKMLNLVEARANNMISDRMGLVRASGTFGAIIFGCYCSFISLFIIYRYEKTIKARYLVALGINLVALICTFSRSSIIAWVILMIIILFRERLKLTEKIIKLFPVLCTGIIVLLVIKPEIFSPIIEMMKSVLISLGLEISISKEFGLNANALMSRLMQWSVIVYMCVHGVWMTGLGYQAFARGQLYFYYPQYSGWFKASALDVGIIGVFSENGVIGVVNLLIFVMTVFLYADKRRKKKKEFNFYKLSVYAIILYCFLNILSAYASPKIFWVFIALFFAYKRLDMKSLMIDEEKMK